LAEACVCANILLMGRLAWVAAIGAVCVSFTAAGARAQSTPAPLFVAPSLGPLSPVPELHLNWPVHPLRISFTASEESGYAAGPLQLFRFDALWVDAPWLKLATVTSAERAFELDCRLTCQPVVKRALDLEARLPLPALGVTTGNYAYVRVGNFRTSQYARPVQELRAGFGGVLNF